MNNTLYFGYVTPTWKDGRKDYTFHYESIKVHETDKQYKVIEINPNLYLDLGSVIKKSEMDRAVFKAAPLAEVGTAITRDMESEARINIIKQVTERIEYLNGRIKARAEQGKRQSLHLVSEIEDCANQLVALYQ
jgi:hypothetical protein|nr:MAG TPA: hypothetical protein [Caudoviricetes sp.]